MLLSARGNRIFRIQGRTSFPRSPGPAPHAGIEAAGQSAAPAAAVPVATTGRRNVEGSNES